MASARPAALSARKSAAIPTRRLAHPSFVRSGPWFAAFLVLALVAFWPSYLSRLGASSAYAHFHALTATIWMSLLIVQPVLMRSRRLALHRAVGRTSYVIAPVILGSMALLGLKGTEAWQAFTRWFARLPLT